MPRPHKPLPIEGAPTADDYKRFWEKVKLTDTCWLWLGHKTPTGYGVFHLLGKNRKAHRAARFLFGLDVPGHLTVDHTCRVRHCVNPAHTEMVTQTENGYRGLSPWSINAQKTHCKHGHPLSGDNLAIELHPDAKRGMERRPTRVCLICKKRRSTEWYAKYKLAKTTTDSPSR